MERQEPSLAQRQRQRTRSGGQYAGYPKCELCGKSCGADYASDPRCNDEFHGRGIMLHEKCVAKIQAMTTEDALKVLIHS